MTTYDLVIVGSGPVGSTVARVVRDLAPGASILMVDAGQRLTVRAGENVRNLDAAERAAAQRLSEGPVAVPSHPTGVLDGRVVGRPGTWLLDPPAADADPHRGMPAAALSTNVGGMGAHWTCASPRPGGSELVGLLPASVLDEAFRRAEALLRVTQDAFPDGARSAWIRERLGDRYDGGVAPHRRVQPMPLACVPSPGGAGPVWVGPAQILGDLAGPEPVEGFTLAGSTIARRIIHEDGRAVGVELEGLGGEGRRTVGARAVVVAADAIRTPQLLHASGIRPPALGRYLNDQPQVIMAAVVSNGRQTEGAAGPTDDVRDSLGGVMWVPFDDERHAFHGQVMQLDASPITFGVVDAPPGATVIGLGWFLPKEIRAEDRVEFSATAIDRYGMPRPRIVYDLTPGDRVALDRAVVDIAAAAAAIGVPVGRPRILPAGSSMHYQGSTRMGAEDDGTSVCDPSGRVWGTVNVYVGGNNVIPTATACNPTLTSVALAVVCARELALLLTDEQTAG